MTTQIIRMVTLSKATRSYKRFYLLDYRILLLKIKNKFFVRRDLYEDGTLKRSFATSRMDYTTASVFYFSYVGELCLNGYKL